MSGGQAMAHAAIRSEAAQWFTLQQSGTLTAEDAHRFRLWLDCSDAHRDAYAAMERAWAIAGAAAEDADIIAMLARDTAARDDPPRWRRRWY